MLEKIKSTVLWIILPLTALFGFIYKILTENKILKDQTARDEVKDKLQSSLEDLEDAKKDADTAESAYRRIKSEYDSDGDGGMSGSA